MNANAPRRSADYLRSRIFFNPHLLPQSYYLNQRSRRDGHLLRIDFVGATSGQERFGHDWAVLKDSLEQRGAKIDDAVLESHNNRRSSPTRKASLEFAAARIDRAALQALCRLR